MLIIPPVSSPCLFYCNFLLPLTTKLFLERLAWLSVLDSYLFPPYRHLAPPLPPHSPQYQVRSHFLLSHGNGETFPTLGQHQELLNLIVSLCLKYITFSFCLLLIPPYFLVELQKCPLNSSPFYVKQF